MKSALIHVAAWFRRRAEDVAVALLLTMFLAFLFQIVFRYVFGWPTGWSFELSIITWLWTVLWGAAFVVTEKEEIRFDIVYGLVSPSTRRAFTVMTGVTLVALYGVSFLAVADYVRFMKVEKSAYLGIRFDVLFSIYVLFAAAAIVRYIWLTWRAIRGEAPPSLIDPNAGGPAL